MRPLATISRLLTLMLLAAFTATAQHKITLTNGDQLSGKLISSETEGIVFLEYPSSARPIKILESSIEKISFNNSNGLADGKHTERIKLSNGDEFPVTLTALDKDSVSFNTTYLGNHTIPRSAVTGIYFNNRAENLLYKGPRKLTEWKQFGGKLKLEDNKIVCLERSRFSRKINDLTDNFKIQFTANWTETSPNMRIYFSTESGDLAKQKDAYYLEINVGGQRLVRKSNRRLNFLGSHLVQADTYKNKSAKFEIFVDRQSKTFSLFMDGKKVKDFKDTGKTPKGSYLIFECLQRHGDQISFQDIIISSWNGMSPANSDKTKKALLNNDLILNTSSSQMAGKIDKIVRANDALELHLNIPFAKKPSIIPTSQLQNIQLQTSENSPEQKPAKFEVFLTLGGLLSFEKSKITGDSIAVTHPIIGDLSIQLSALKAIQKTATE